MSVYELKTELTRTDCNSILDDEKYFDLNTKAKQLVDDLVALFNENMDIMQSLVTDVQNVNPDGTYYTKDAIDERIDDLNEAVDQIRLALLDSVKKDNQFESYIREIKLKIDAQIESLESAKALILNLEKKVTTLENLDKDNKILSWQNIEYTSEFIRQTMNSGVLDVNNTSLTLPINAFEKGIDTAYSVLNIHNHPNYDCMAGMGWFAYISNGFLGQTRHNDYKLVKASVGAFNTVKNEAPSVPNDDFTVYNMKNLFERYLARQLQDDEKELFRWDMSYLESWWQEVDSLDEYISDTFDSFRHTYGNVKPTYLANRFSTSRAEGKKSRFENIPFAPIASKSVDSNGNTTYTVLMYRITTAPLPSLNGKLWDEIMEQKEDMPNLAKFGDVSELSSKAKFRVTTDFDAIVENISGLGGLDENITSHKTIDGYNIFANKPLSNYHRKYSLQDDDAVGRRDYVNGWNDPTLITALTDTSIISSGTSYMIPLEMILRTPLETWNPNNLEVKERSEISGDGTNANPFNGINENFYNYHTPAEFYSGATNVDPADTGVGVKAIENQDGNATLNMASGIYIVLPEIDGIEDRVRIRFPINWKSNEFSIAQTELESFRKENNEMLAVIKLHQLKTANRGVSNE